MMMVLSTTQMAKVKATAPVLAERGAAITRHFYQRMFANHPELRNLFNQTHQRSGNQPEALARAVWAYAAHIDNLGALKGAIANITNKHISVGVRPDQYAIVGENLLASIVEVLGDAVDGETLDAWKAAYAQLANVLIGEERRLSESAAWQGFRPFVVRQKVVESEEITSFYLEPADGGPLPPYEPGQYISVKRFIDAINVEQPRQYSLSDAPNGRTLRISVKREAGRLPDVPAGLMSNTLHDSVPVGEMIEVSAPAGVFTLDRAKCTPVVLMSGGVGLTPMVSMLATLVAERSERRTLFVHACRNGAVHAFRDWLNDIVATHPNVTKRIHYEHVRESDRLGLDYDVAGRCEPSAWLDDTLVVDADFYLCGPAPFMVTQRQALLDAGVDGARIHTEVFGSGTLG
jgi:nitric oxide dioxygenase